MLAALLWLFGKFLRYSFPPLFELLAVSYDVSTTQLGWAFTGFMLAYAAMQFPSGVVADRIGTVRVIVAGALVSSATALSLGFETPFPVLVAAMVVLGAGTGVHKTVAVRLLSRTYPSRTGRVLGVFDTFGTFGGVLAPVAVILAASLPAAQADSGWRTLLVLTGFVGIVLTLAFLWRVPQRLQNAEADGSAHTVRRTQTHDTVANGPDWGDYISLVRNRRFSTFILLTICFSFTYNGVVSFLPLYLTREAGLTAGTAGALYSALFVASLVQLGSGELSDRVGTLPVIVSALCLGTVALTTFVFATGRAGPVVLGIAVVSLGVGAHGFRPVRGAYLMETVPDTIAAGGFGLVRTLLMAAGAVAPGVIGTLADTAGFRPAFWVLACSIGIAALLSMWLWITRPES